MAALTVEKENFKVEEVTAIILNDENFKKIGSSNEDGVFIASSSHGRTNPHGNN